MGNAVGPVVNLTRLQVLEQVDDSSGAPPVYKGRIELDPILLDVVSVSVFIFNPFFNHFYCPTRPTVPTLSLCFPMFPYASLYDLYNLDVFPYDADTHTPFPLILLTTIHKIPRARLSGPLYP